eukprot:SAG11_NODE_3571_length_2362_cov_3.051701_2_plen_230_part_00
MQLEIASKIKSANDAANFFNDALARKMRQQCARSLCPFIRFYSDCTVCKCIILWHMIISYEDIFRSSRADNISILLTTSVSSHLYVPIHNVPIHMSCRLDEVKLTRFHAATEQVCLQRCLPKCCRPYKTVLSIAELEFLRQTVLAAVRPVWTLSDDQLGGSADEAGARTDVRVAAIETQMQRATLQLRKQAAGHTRLSGQVQEMDGKLDEVLTLLKELKGQTNKNQARR